MATDSALLAGVRNGARPVLRLYRWAPPCISFGRNQQAVGIYDAERIRACGYGVVRRPTGGLAVLHDREVTYAVVVPVDVFGGLRRAYTAVNAALVAGLRRLGVVAELASDGTPRPPIGTSSDTPCFASPAVGEVVAAGAKLVGSAQRREGRALLQHGSILIEGGQGVLGSVARTTPSAVATHATLRDLLGYAPGWHSVANAIVEGFRDCGIDLEPATLSPEEQASADALIDRFQDDVWTWRR